MRQKNYFQIGSAAAAESPQRTTIQDGAGINEYVNSRDRKIDRSFISVYLHCDNTLDRLSMRI